MGLLAATPPAGFALTGATPNILQYTFPNDGRNHRFFIVSFENVTLAQTGGAVQVEFTLPDGTQHNLAVYNASQGAGVYGIFGANAQSNVAPGTTLTLQQTSAQTAGAAVLWAEIWGS